MTDMSVVIYAYLYALFVQKDTRVAVTTAWLLRRT